MISIASAHRPCVAPHSFLILHFFLNFAAAALLEFGIVMCFPVCTVVDDVAVSTYYEQIFVRAANELRCTTHSLYSQKPSSTYGTSYENNRPLNEHDADVAQLFVPPNLNLMKIERLS